MGISYDRSYPSSNKLQLGQKNIEPNVREKGKTTQIAKAKLDMDDKQNQNKHPIVGKQTQMKNKQKKNVLSVAGI